MIAHPLSTTPPSPGFLAEDKTSTFLSTIADSLHPPSTIPANTALPVKVYCSKIHPHRQVASSVQELTHLFASQ